MNHEDQLDVIIREALQSKEDPADDFTGKVMERVAKVSQTRAVPYRKILVSLAACAAVLVVALPILRLSTMSMGKSASDCGAEAACAADEAVAEASAAMEEDRSAVTYDSCNDAASAPVKEETHDDTEQKIVDIGSAKGKSTAAEVLRKDAPVVIGDDALCAALRTWLAENGFSAAEEEQKIEFDLTPEQTAALREAFPALALPDGGCTIRLEGEI